MLSLEEFNEYFTKKTKILLSNSNVENGIKNKEIDNLESIVFPNEITLVWENIDYQKELEFDISDLGKRVKKIYGDKMRVKKILSVNEIEYEITKTLSEPVTVEKLLKEMGELGENYPEPGIFYGLKHESENRYIIDWTR